MRGCVRIELYQGRDLVSRLAAFLGSPPDGIFVVRTAPFQARWRLGQLLSPIEQSGHGVTSRYSKKLQEIGLNRVRANECERIIVCGTKH